MGVRRPQAQFCVGVPLCGLLLHQNATAPCAAQRIVVARCMKGGRDGHLVQSGAQRVRSMCCGAGMLVVFLDTWEEEKG